MDSKLRRTAILSSMALILLVSLLVVFTNMPKTGPGSGSSTPAPEQENPSEGGEEGPKEGQIGNDLSAFLRDNTFFDQEINPVLEAAKENASRLSLVFTSVEKDLSIQIVDIQGNPVTGESFYVKLEGEG